ncbi:MAG: competence/damage-inducible protein A [bacterium]
MSTARILIVGDEILHGEIVDENGPWLIQKLNECSVEVELLSIIPDNFETLVRQIKQNINVDYLIISGGIGPTHDDKTRQALARALDKPLVENSYTVQLLKDHYKNDMNKPRREMAMLPENSEVIYLSEIPAIAFKNDNVYVFPGIPSMLKPLFKKWEKKFKGSKCFTYSLTLQAREGDIAEILRKLQAKHPKLQFASYPHAENITLLVRGYEPQEFQRGKQALTEKFGQKSGQ